MDLDEGTFTGYIEKVKVDPDLRVPVNITWKGYAATNLVVDSDANC